MEFNWLYVIGTLIAFLAFWGVIAYRMYKTDNKPFLETWTRRMGFYFWYKHIGAQILLSIIPSIVFTFLLFSIIPYSLKKGTLLKTSGFILAAIYFMIPIFVGILFLFFRKNEKVMKNITYINSFWFTIMLLCAILFGFVAYFMNR